MAQIFVSLTDVARVGNFHIFIIFLLQPKTRNVLLWKYHNIIQKRYHDYSKISYNMNIIHILDTLLSSPLKQPETLQLLCWSIFQFSLPSSNFKNKKNLFNFTNSLAIIDSGMTVETCVGPDDLVWLSSSLHDLRNM